MAPQNYNERVYAFEYVLKQLLGWQRESGCYSQGHNDISILKAVKLLFFISAVNSNKHGSNYLLLQVFKDFVAMPYGHVESVIYNQIRFRGGELNYYRIDTACTTIIEGKNPDELNVNVEQQTRTEIDQSIQKLRNINHKLICMSAFDLVELSHSWYSWRKTYSTAQAEGNASKPIDPQDIISEDKIFKLQAF